MKTNWSTPKTNIFAALNELRRALAAGQNARLIRMRNEDCQFPIKVKQQNTDFRNYEFQNGTLQSRESISKDDKSVFQKYLSLTYKTCYGTPEAKDRYYETGLLSPDNFKGMGTSHLVKIEDMVVFMMSTGDEERAEMFAKQYLDSTTGHETHFFDNFKYMHGSPWAVKLYKRRLWVVELLGDEKAELSLGTGIAVTVLKAIIYPTKFIPRRSVLRMSDYKCVTYRIGSVVNGFSVEFNVPKRFSFSSNERY